MLPGSSSSLSSESQLGDVSPTLSDAFFLPTEKKDGKGVLMEREWRDRAMLFAGLRGWSSESEELESAP